MSQKSSRLKGRCLQSPRTISQQHYTQKRHLPYPTSTSPLSLPLPPHQTQQHLSHDVPCDPHPMNQDTTKLSIKGRRLHLQWSLITSPSIPIPAKSQCSHSYLAWALN